MGQFDNDIKIEVALNDIDSIKRSLKKYQDLLKTDQAVEDQVFQVEFVKRVDGEIKALQKEDGDIDLLRSLNVWEESTLSRREISLNENASEVILFSHALTYEALKMDVVETAREMVRYARRHNDTWEMWMDDMEVFGVEALYALSQKHPEYAYLFGAFIIPYWDTEHADYALSYPYALVDKFGLDDNMLKMFCHCDNSEARAMMLGRDYYGESFETDLAKHFEENPQRYERFQEILLERFKDQDYLQYSKQDHTALPVHEFYQTIMLSKTENQGNYDLYDHPCTGMESPFMTTSFDDEATLLHSKIEKTLGRPLTEPSRDEDDLYEDLYEDYCDAWVDFFKGLCEGESVWNYIQTGQGEEILDDLKALDLEAFTKDHGLKLYEAVKEEASQYGGLENNIDRIFADYINAYYEMSEEPDMITRVNGEDITGRDMILRALDVLHRLLPHKALENDLYERVIEDKVISHEGYNARYDQRFSVASGAFQFIIESALVPVTDKPNADLMTRAYHIMNQDRTSFYEGLIKEEDHLDAVLMFMMFALHEDYKSRLGDDVTKDMMDYVANHWLENLLEKLSEDGNFSSSDLKKIRVHIEGPQMPPQSLMMKAMQVGLDGLNQDEKALIKSAKQDQVSFEEAVGLLKTKLTRYRDDPTEPREYMILTSSDEGLSFLLPSWYFSIFRIPAPFSKQMVSALKLFVDIAPVKTLKMISDMLYRNFDSELDETNVLYDMEQDLKKIGVKNHHFIALDIVKGNGEKLDALYEAYIENDTRGGLFGGPSRAEIDRALLELKSYTQENFITEIAKRDKASVMDRYMTTFNKMMESYVLESMLLVAVYTEKILQTYDAIAYKSWDNLSDEKKEKLLKCQTDLKYEDIVEDAYAQLFSPGYVLFEESDNDLYLICGHEILELIRPAAKDGSDLSQMLKEIKFVQIKQGDISKEDLADIQRSKTDVSRGLSQTILEYILKGHHEKEALDIFHTFERPRYHDSLRKNSVFLTDAQHERYLKLLLTTGKDGFDMGYRQGVDLPFNYGVKLKNCGAALSDIAKWLIDEDEVEAFIGFAHKYGYDYVVDWSIEERLDLIDSLKMLENAEDIIGKLVDDKIIRVRNRALEALEFIKAQIEE